ncbi:MAG: hypothetical protein JSV43_07470 [Methanobacteriota archaeon]|nr:MAG: hypothetical protein JSV43_07470 [Euryarchaeota archaeon]
MTGKAKLLILWNLIVLFPALGSFFYWLTLTFRVAFQQFTAQSLVYLLFVLSILLITATIVNAIRLKMSILSDVGDSGLTPIKRVYKGATHINWACYIVLYPLTLGINIGQIQMLNIFLIAALLLALPLQTLISARKKQYQRIKQYYQLGKWNCPNCNVSMAFHRQTRKWVCYRCGKKYSAR